MTTTRGGLPPFYAGRSLISVGFVFAMIASPDILFQRLAKGEAARAQAVGARIDAAVALAFLLSKPYVGAIIDSKGRKFTLVWGCLISGIARYVAARWGADSATAYFLYRVVNAAAVIPVQQACVALLVDVCGGRHTEEFQRTNRRMWIGLGLVRLATTQLLLQRLAGTSSERLMLYAAYSSLTASLVFQLFVDETLRPEERKPFRGIVRTYADSLTFFFKSPLRRRVALLFLLRGAPQFIGSSTIQNYLRERHGFEREERTRLQLADNLAEIFVPLALVEALGRKTPTSHDSRRRGFLLSLFASTVSLTNTIAAPRAGWVYANPVVDRLFAGEDTLMSELVTRIKKEAHEGAVGEGEIESAFGLLEFPFSFALPSLLAPRAGSGDVRSRYALPFGFVYACYALCGGLAMTV